MSDLYIKAVAPSVSRSTATLMKTGQTTSYRTGDDGDLEAGRATDFLTLAENNPFGNTNRFTSELGTQIYTNNIVIDWSTYNGTNVLGFYRIVYGSSIWNSTIDYYLSLSVAGFTSGWRLPNVQELKNLQNYGVTARWNNYNPFNVSGAGNSIWSSTTNPSATGQAYYFLDHRIINEVKGAALWSIGCRTFTVIGTTLS